MLILPIQFSVKVTQFALDLPSLFKETILSLPPESVQVWNYVSVRTFTGQLQGNLLPYSIKLSSVCASGVLIQS